MAVRLTLAVLAALAVSSSGGEIDRLPTRAKIVALTFDAGGNDAGAARLVRTLERDHVRATFFLTGRFARTYPRLARTLGRRFAIGNHTYSHPNLTGLPSPLVRQEIQRGAFWIRAKTGRDPRPLFRFPYGARDARTIAIARSLGYADVYWSTDTWGWMGSPAQSRAGVVHRVLERVRPGEIVLMHVGASRDGSTLDAAALPTVIRDLRARGYRFVTLRPWVRRA
ncbi:MAG: polysaccharide deacetylase family protein [Gaiellaceae bacterium]